MKKICFILPTLGGGGAEKVALHILNNLNLKKFDIVLILIYKDRGDYLKELRKEVKKIFLNKTHIKYSLYPLFKTIKNEKPDIIINFSFDLMILIGNFIIPFFKNIYFITRQANILSLENFSPFKKHLLKKAYQNFHKIITQSGDMTLDLLNNINIDRNKIIEINNPVDIKKINKLSNENINIEFNDEERNLLCVGRLVKQKGFDLIIEVISNLNNKNIKLYILGEGIEKEKLERLIKKKKLERQVFLLGRKENPYIYMKKADLFILSSRYEGFPNVLIEANACGLYAICNNCLGGINEIIKENINGNIIDFRDVSLTTDIILNKLASSKNKEEILQTVKNRYSLEIIISKYQFLFLNKD